MASFIVPSLTTPTRILSLPEHLDQMVARHLSQLVLLGFKGKCALTATPHWIPYATMISTEATSQLPNEMPRKMANLWIRQRRNHIKYYYYFNRFRCVNNQRMPNYYIELNFILILILTKLTLSIVLLNHSRVSGLSCWNLACPGHPGYHWHPAEC